MNISTYLRNVDALVGISNIVAGVYHYEYSVYGQILFDRDMDFKVKPPDESWVGDFSILEYHVDYSDRLRIYHLIMLPAVTVYNFDHVYKYDQNRKLVKDNLRQISAEVWMINGA